MAKFTLICFLFFSAASRRAGMKDLLRCKKAFLTAR